MKSLFILYFHYYCSKKSASIIHLSATLNAGIVCLFALFKEEFIFRLFFLAHSFTVIISLAVMIEILL